MTTASLHRTITKHEFHEELNQKHNGGISVSATMEDYPQEGRDPWIYLYYIRGDDGQLVHVGTWQQGEGWEFIRD